MSLYLTGINSKNNNSEINQQSYNNIKPIKIKKKPSNKFINYRKNKSIDNNIKNLLNEDSTINKKSKLKKKPKKKLSKSFDSKNKNNNLIEIKTKFINFLIDNELKYANLYNIEIYYEEQIKKKKHIHDNNLIIIQQKKQEYKNYINEIQKEIINKYVLQKKQINDYYNNKINQLKKIIKYKQYEQEIFQNIFNRTYKTNFLMKNRITDELKFSNVYNEQYKQYLIIKNNSLGQISTQEKKLKYIKEFNQKILSEQKFKIKKKMEIEKNLENKLSILKENMKNYSLNLDKIKNQNKNLKNKLNFFIKIYYNINIEYKNLFKEYLINKLSLLNLFNLFKLNNYKNNNNIDTLILYCKDAKKNINLMRNQIINKNFEITKKNIIISQLNKELKEIYDKIEIKNINEKKEANKNDSKNTEQIKKYINQKKFAVSNIQKKNMKIILLIEKIINLLIDKNKILFFNFPLLKKSSVDIFIRNKNHYKLKFNNNFFDLNIYKNILNMFNKLINSIVYIYINVYNRNSYNFITNNEKNNNNNFMIFNIENINLLSKNNNIKEIKEKPIIDNKKNEKDDYQNNSKSNSNLNNSINLTKYDLFNKFVNYIDNNNINNSNNNINLLSPNEKLNLSASMKNLNSNLFNKSFILSNQNKIINYFDKYENNLVKKNIFNLKNKIKNMSKTSNKFTEKKNLIKSKSFKESVLPSINKNKKIQEDFLSTSTNNSHHNSIFLEENMEYDSEDNEKIEKIDTLKTKKQIFKKNKSFTYFFLKNPEKSQVLTRLNDLRKLNVSFFNKKNNNEEKNLDNFKFKNELLNFIKSKKKEEKKHNENKEIMSERPRAKTFNIFGNFKFNNNSKNISSNINSKNLSTNKLKHILPNKSFFGKNKNIKKIEKKNIENKSHSQSKNYLKNNNILFKKNNNILNYTHKENNFSQSKIKYYKPNQFD